MSECGAVRGEGEGTLPCALALMTSSPHTMGKATPSATGAPSRQGLASQQSSGYTVSAL